MILNVRKFTDAVPKGGIRAACLLAIGFLMLPFGTASGYDDAEAQKTAEYMKKYRFETMTTKEGLTFSIPSDMPIDRKNGLVQPIPYEEYLYIKFKLMEERMKSMEEHLDKMEEKILAKFTELKTQIKSLEVKSETPEPAAPEKITS